MRFWNSRSDDNQSFFFGQRTWNVIQIICIVNSHSHFFKFYSEFRLMSVVSVNRFSNRLEISSQGAHSDASDSDEKYVFKFSHFKFFATKSQGLKGVLSF